MRERILADIYEKLGLKTPEEGAVEKNGGIQETATSGLEYFHTSPGPTFSATGAAVKYCQVTTPPPWCAPTSAVTNPGPVACTSRRTSPFFEAYASPWAGLPASRSGR